jgi:hypothetical protein
MDDFQETTAYATTRAGAFSSINMASVIRNVHAARVILRTVLLALGAVEDGAASFDDKSGASRWFAAIGVACSRMAMVRDELMETSNAPPLDWIAPMAMLEALDAALWFGYSCPDETRLTNVEAMSSAQVVIDSLDEFLLACDEVGKPEPPPVH